MRRVLSVLLTLALVAGVGYALYISVGNQWQARNVVQVRGVIGSEKEAFFTDPEVTAALRKKGFEVKVDKAGSRQIATLDLKDYDFAFPAGVPAAEKLKREKGAKTTINVFFSPMAIATWDSIFAILQANGLAGQSRGYAELNMERMVALMQSGKRWGELKNSQAYAVNKSVLISSTDVRKSNSAAMYLSLISYIANSNNIVQDNAQAQALLPSIEPLFLKQGFQEASSAGPFEDYLLLGVGKAPMVMVYEHQFIEKAAQKQLRPGMMLMYPKPTLFTKHVLVPLTGNGARLGQLLEQDLELQNLAIRYGFRNANTAGFERFLQQHNLKLPTDLVDVVDPPSYEVLEGMILRIEQAYSRIEGPSRANLLPEQP